MPRSLKDPVGFRPSYLMKTSQPRPTIALSRGEWISGVEPSFSEMTGVRSVTGKNSRHRAITPRSWNVEKLIDAKKETLMSAVGLGKLGGLRACTESRYFEGQRSEFIPALGNAQGIGPLNAKG
jgi:hypothetical protein